MPRDSRLAPVFESVASWLVEKIVITGALGGGGLEALLAWNQPISWADYFLRVSCTAAAVAVVCLGVADILDRRRPLRLVSGQSGTFVEETTDAYRLFRVGLVNRYTRTVDDVQVRLVSREPGQGTDMGRRFREKDTRAFQFAVERGSGPTRYIDLVGEDIRRARTDEFVWFYELPPGAANVTPSDSYTVRLEATGRDVRESQIDLLVEQDASGRLMVSEIRRTSAVDGWTFALVVECLVMAILVGWFVLS